MKGLTLSLTIAIIILAIPALACASSTSTPAAQPAEVQATEIPIPTEIPQKSPTPEPSATIASSRCVPASSIQTSNILVGVQDVDNNNSIKEAWAVKSNDYNDVWMVAAFIYGPGIEEGVGPGVWAMNGDPDQQGLIYSVDGFATEFSVWPDGSKTDAAISQFDDGVMEAQNCATENK